MALWGNAENTASTDECATFGVYFLDWNKESCTLKCQMLCETAASGKIDIFSYLLYTMLYMQQSDNCIFCAPLEYAFPELSAPNFGHPIHMLVLYITFTQ